MKIKTKKKRKIQQTGYTHWVSLPPVWIESLDLFKGSELSMQIHENGDLVIRKDETTKQT